MDELEEERSLKLKELLSEYFDKRRDLDMSKEFQQEKEEEESLNKFKVVCVYAFEHQGGAGPQSCV